MEQEIGTIPEFENVVPCSRRVTPDYIQRQIRQREDEFATSPDGVLLRTASTWLVRQHAWVRRDLQLEVYGTTSRWVFYAGNRSNQVAFYAPDTPDNEASPTWEHKSWCKKLYDGTKMVLKYLGKYLPLAAPLAFAIPVHGPIIAAVFGIIGLATAGAAEVMEEIDL